MRLHCNDTEFNKVKTSEQEMGLFRLPIHVTWTLFLSEYERVKQIFVLLLLFMKTAKHFSFLLQSFTLKGVR